MSFLPVLTGTSDVSWDAPWWMWVGAVLLILAGLLRAIGRR